MRLRSATLELTGPGQTPDDVAHAAADLLADGLTWRMVSAELVDPHVFGEADRWWAVTLEVQP